MSKAVRSGVDASVLAERIIGETREAVFALSPDGEILAWSRGAELLSGFASAESLGRSIVELLVPEEHRPSFASALREVAENAATEVFLPRSWRHCNGTLLHVGVWLRWTSLPDLKSFIVGSARDSAPLHRARATAESACDGGIFHLLFEAAPDAMVVVDRYGDIALVNIQADVLRHLLGVVKPFFSGVEAWHLPTTFRPRLRSLVFRSLVSAHRPAVSPRSPACCESFLSTPATPSS